MTAWTSSSLTLTNGSILLRCRRDQAISPWICRFRVSGDAPFDAQIGGELLGRLLELRLGVAGEILVDLGLGDLDVGLLGGLDLEDLVDEVAKHLLAQPRQLLGRDLAPGREPDDGEAVIDLGAGDDGAVDDRRRLADVGILLGR